MTKCRGICKKMRGRNLRNNWVSQFWCSECFCFIPIRYLFKKYGLICSCCMCRVRTKPRKKKVQLDDNYPRIEIKN